MKVFIDIVLMSIINGELGVLLIKRNREPFLSRWALPGGYIPEDMNLDEAANFQLEREIGLKNIYIEQLYSFGDVSRDPRGRTISVSYLALVDHKKIEALVTEESQDVKWIRLSKLPKLAFDHSKIVKFAQKRIINKIRYTRVGFDLVGDTFTMNELVSTFETIIGESIDQSNLRKKLLKLDVIDETDDKVVSGKGRPSPIFKLNRKVLGKLPITETFFKL